MQPKIKSNELSLQVANKSTEVVCYRCGGRDYRTRGLTKAGKQRYFCMDCRRHFVEKVDLEKYRPSYLELGDDVWDASELGVRVSAYKRQTKLVFSYLKQNWLKDAAKKFVKFQAISKSFSQLQRYITNLNKFSDFLEIYYPTTDFGTINRELVIDFIDFLNRQGLAWETKNKILSHLKSFFETGNINSWFKVPAYLVRREDKAKPVKRLPRYIPEEVMQQLNQHLDVLPEPVVRMVLVLQETGLRLGELLQLPINCLKHNAGGDPFIQYMNWKMSKEDTKPISPELAKVIQEQQQYIRQYLGEKFEYLFCARETGKYHRDENRFYPKPKLMCPKSFINFLKKLAEDADINDSSGKRWNFQAHQFRHTVGTRMVNLGVPLHIIQRYLGHESPQMTMVYAHIYDETLRKEVEKYHESRVVNFQGETAELEETVLSSNDDASGDKKINPTVKKDPRLQLNNSNTRLDLFFEPFPRDLEWFKKNVQARALEHGYCARPKVLGDCDIPGFDGCYNCPHWRTNKNFLPILKDTKKRTIQVLDKAQKYGWQLQINKNKPLKDNLERVIRSLESDNNE